jgi:hypothetical protein
MAESNTRSDQVNVEHIMQQIRARIRERRGADDTEQQIRELAAAKIEGILGSDKTRIGLLDTIRRGGTSTREGVPSEGASVFGSSRGPLGWIRRLLRPILGLFLSPGELDHTLQRQAGINARHEQYDEVSFELLQDLVLETTRLEIEVKKLEMRLESQSSRFDFAERRARSLEGIVRYQSEQRPETDRGQRRTSPERGSPERAPAPLERTSPERPEPVQAGSPGQPAPGRDAEPTGGSDARRRRRRRRGRRGGLNRAPGEGAQDSGEQVPGGPAPAEAGGSESGGSESGAGSGEGPSAPTVGPEPPDRDDK